MSNEAKSNYWLDVAADEILGRFPEGEIVISSGISPSASYHIGHFREIMTADALAWAVRKRGRKSRHIHVVDNFDPLRKWYDFLPKAHQDYSGWPVALVPDPYGNCHASYADHFYAEFEKQLEPMGIRPEIVRSYEELYKPNRMVAYIEKALDHTESIKKTFEDVSNRELDPNWTPVFVLKDQKFEKGDLSTWDRNAKTINGLSYENGNAKLDWRLDWPARWAELGVNVEPFGAQEHGASGGSYDTAKIFAKNVFGIDAPFDAARYGHIHRPGENVKMSSSKGNVVTPEEALHIMPAEILRYFIVRSRPEKKIFFDPGAGLYNLVDEFAAAQADSAHEFRDAYEFAVEGDTKQVISSIPFKHLVSVYQAAQGHEDEILETLKRTDYEEQAVDQKGVIIDELKFVKNWLDKYAPEEVKFQVQDELPKAELTDTQRAFLARLATSIAKQTGDISGQEMHEIIYAAREQTEMKPQDAFQAIYRVILGKDSGPKAGWFLSSLDKNWLVERLNLRK